MTYRRRTTVTGAWSRSGKLRRVRRVSKGRSRSRSPKLSDVFGLHWLFGYSKHRRKV